MLCAPVDDNGATVRERKGITMRLTSRKFAVVAALSGFTSLLCLDAAAQPKPSEKQKASAAAQPTPAVRTNAVPKAEADENSRDALTEVAASPVPTNRQQRDSLGVGNQLQEQAAPPAANWPSWIALGMSFIAVVLAIGAWVLEAKARRKADSVTGNTLQGEIAGIANQVDGIAKQVEGIAKQVEHTLRDLGIVKESLAGQQNAAKRQSSPPPVPRDSPRAQSTATQKPRDLIEALTIFQDCATQALDEDDIESSSLLTQAVLNRCPDNLRQMLSTKRFSVSAHEGSNGRLQMGFRRPEFLSITIDHNSYLIPCPRERYAYTFAYIYAGDGARWPSIVKPARCTIQPDGSAVISEKGEL